VKSITISKTPLRISFVGGGSDLSVYYENVGEGRVISTSIDKFIYITVHKRYDDLIRASYSKTELLDNIDDIKHELIRESLKFMNVKKGVEVTSISDLTAHGTGLGSSSAYTVGVLNAIARYKKINYSRFNLANDACLIEIDKCNQPIGKQDQFASVFGGLNEIVFTKKSVDVIPINIKTDALAELSNNLLLFDTGIKRKSSTILKNQKKSYEFKDFKKTSSLVALVPEFKKVLTSGSIDDAGRILHESWAIKRSIVKGITSDEIDNCYKTAINAGALGGKLCGAGGGGFLMFYVKDNCKEAVRKSLTGLKELDFNFDYEGAKIL